MTDTTIDTRPPEPQIFGAMLARAAQTVEAVSIWRQLQAAMQAANHAEAVNLLATWPQRVVEAGEKATAPEVSQIDKLIALAGDDSISDDELTKIATEIGRWTIEHDDRRGS